MDNHGRNKYTSQNAIEIMKKNKKQKIRPKVLGLKIREKFAKEMILHFIVYWFSFLFWAYISLTQITMILILGSIMWTLGFVATKIIPDREYEIAVRTRSTMLKYTVTLLGWRIVVFIITKTPTSLWEQALAMPLNPAFTQAFVGFIAMAFVIGMFSVFISYIGYIFQLFEFYKSRNKVDQSIKMYVRREVE